MPGANLTANSGHDFIVLSLDDLGFGGCCCQVWLGCDCPGGSLPRSRGVDRISSFFCCSHVVVLAYLHPGFVASFKVQGQFREG